jgi:DNA-binding winged helix-turn-helix (wHTH) protein
MRLASGDWVFDSDTREVIREGAAVPLSPKAFDLLELLIRRRPKAVSKADIHQHLWPGTFVSPANLANLIGELRAALGDDARAPRILRTVPRFGYAFAADAAAAPEKAPARSRAPFTCHLVWGPREIPLDPGDHLIGRDHESAVWIDDASVSRRHARISLDDSGATIEDLASKNGTFVRGRRIEKPARLADKDAIRIGPASMILRLFKRAGSTASTVEKRGRA